MMICTSSDLVMDVKVKLRFMAVLKPLAKNPVYELEIEDGATLSVLLKKLIQEERKELLARLLDPSEASLQSDILVLINGIEISALEGLNTKLRDGDEVVFLPTVHGGSLEFVAPWWDEFYFKILRLADLIEASGFKPDIIVGVARGGWIVARLLSDFLDNPNVVNVKVEFYRGVAETMEEPKISQPLSASVKGCKVLIADDVADTGKSLEVVKRHVEEKGASEVKIATVYYKPWSIIKPDFYVDETTCWVIFPHEVKETMTKLLTRWLSEGISVEEAKEKLLKSGIKLEVLEALLPKVLSKLS